MRMKFFGASICAFNCLLVQAAPEVQQESRVITFPKCPVSNAASKEMAPAALALLKIVAPIAFEKAIDMAASAAKAAGEDSQAKTAISSYQGNFYKWNGESLSLNSSLGCIVYTRGVFGNQAIEPSDGWKTSGYSTVARTLGMVGHPGFYMELTMEVSADRTLFRLVPEYLDFSTPLEASSWRPKDRAASISLSFYNPAVKEPFASTSINFGRLSPGTFFRKTYLEGYKSNWMALPMPSEITGKLINDDVELARKVKANNDELTPGLAMRPQNSKDVTLNKLQEVYCNIIKLEKKDDAVNCPRNFIAIKATIADYQRDIQAEEGVWKAQLTKVKLDAAQLARKMREQDARTKSQPWVFDTLQPFNLDVTMVEMAAGSEFLKFVGNVLSASKQEVVAAVKSKVQADPVAEKAKAEDEIDKAYIAAIDAKALVERKLAEVKGATDDVEREKISTDLPSLKLKANIAYRKAGLPDPYPGIVP